MSTIFTIAVFWVKLTASADSSISSPGETDVLNLFPKSLMKEKKIVAILKEQNWIHVAMVNPSDQASLSDLSSLFPGHKFLVSVCAEEDFDGHCLSCRD